MHQKRDMKGSWIYPPLESGTGGGGDVHFPLTEYRHPVYRHSDDIGDMSGDGAMAEGTGVDEMVGEGRTRPSSGRDGYGDKYGGLGGRLGK